MKSYEKLSSLVNRIHSSSYHRYSTTMVFAFIKQALNYTKYLVISFDQPNASRTIIWIIS